MGVVSDSLMHHICNLCSAGKQENIMCITGVSKSNTLGPLEAESGLGWAALGIPQKTNKNKSSQKSLLVFFYNIFSVICCLEQMFFSHAQTSLVLQKF